jgi:hypothetical protein
MPSRDLTLSGIAGTMFELVQALNDGAESLKKRVPNPISLTAGCELFIGFVTLFPHESAVSQHIEPIKSTCLMRSLAYRRIFPSSRGRSSTRGRATHLMQSISAPR